MHDIQNMSREWSARLQWLAEKQISKNLAEKLMVEKVYMLLATLPWKDQIYGFEMKLEVSDLTVFLSNAWFATTQEDMMLEILRDDLLVDRNTAYQHTIVSLTFSNKLTSVFHNRCPEESQAHYIVNAKWMHTVRNNLLEKCCSSVGFIFNINITQRHWIALIVDVLAKCIQYGDSLGNDPPDYLIGAVQSWLAMHTIYDFETVPLDLPKQEDGHSCGLLAIISLGHFYLPKKYPLVKADQCDLSCMQMLQRIIQ